MNTVIRDILAVLPDGVKVCSVNIVNGKIASIGPPPEGAVFEKTISGTGRLLIPGLVNAHTHAAMTLFRNYADDLMFQDWLFGKILPIEEHLTGEACYWGTTLAAAEMVRTGTTSFIDMYFFMDDVAKAVSETGIRAVLSRGLSGDADNPSGEKSLREALDEIKRWQGHENISFMLAPHAPYTCDPGFQKEVAAEARRLDLGINTHLSESLSEIETIRAKYDCTPIELAEKTGLLSQKTVAAHCVHLTEHDIALLKKYGVTVATNPVSNLKLANGVAPITKLMKAGINIAMGTDGAASNNALNMFRELGVVTLIHKGIEGDAQAVSAADGFRFATLGGAAAIGQAGLLGEIRPGMIADLAILDLDHPNMQPVGDPVSALAYSANGSEVETVMVGGKILMENRQFTTIDTEHVYYETAQICKRIGMR